MPTEYWFPTPIYYDKLSEKESQELKKECLAVYNQLQLYPRAGEQSLHQITTQDFSQNVIEEYDMKKLKKYIDSSLRQYVPTRLVDVGYKIATSWFTCTEKGQRALEHNHGSNDVSGCYYVQTNEQDGRINFHNRGLTSASIFYSMQESISYVPEEGRIILFPSYQSHSTDQNTTDSQRISVSFNVIFNKTVL